MKKTAIKPSKIVTGIKGGSMTIQEAIREAGPGGRIAREIWFEDGRYIIWYKIPTHHSEPLKASQTASDCILQVHLEATDWEVIKPEPEIEVGDIVKCFSNLANPQIEYQVISRRGRELKLISLVELHVDSSMCSLIRKGPKEIKLEGIKFYGHQPPTGKPFTVIAQGNDECSVLPYKRVSDLHDNGKTYNMILRERE